MVLRDVIIDVAWCYLMLQSTLHGVTSCYNQRYVVSPDVTVDVTWCYLMLQSMLHGVTAVWRGSATTSTARASVSPASQEPSATRRLVLSSSVTLTVHRPCSPVQRVKARTVCLKITWGRYHGGRRPSSDDSFHSPTVILPPALDKPNIMKRYHRRRTCSHTSPRRSPTMVTLRDSRFVECRWWNDGWTVKAAVT